MSEKVKILAVTGSRADWGLLKSPVQCFQQHKDFQLELLVTGTHLDPTFGHTIDEIKKDGVDVNHILPILDEAIAEVTALSKVIEGCGKILAEERPDFLLILGDRYEILGAANAALMARIPIIHICGGDITEGAIDDAIRHAITKMSHIHFVSNTIAAQRVAQMGENPAHIFNVGSPGLDTIPTHFKHTSESFKTLYGLDPNNPLFLVTFHPVTLDEISTLDQLSQLFEALDDLGPDYSALFTGSNADMEGRAVTKAIVDYVKARPNMAFRHSLGHELYFEGLNACDLVVGNSSSGLYEVPSFKIATINIGNRQNGRLKALSVVDCTPNKSYIKEAILEGLEMDVSEVINPYGTGSAGKQIVEIMSNTNNFHEVLHKKFFLQEQK